MMGNEIIASSTFSLSAPSYAAAVLILNVMTVCRANPKKRQRAECRALGAMLLGNDVCGAQTFSSRFVGLFSPHFRVPDFHD